MGVTTRNALNVILIASTAVSALAALLWLDSLAFDWAGYSVGSRDKLFIAWLAGTSAFLAWRMLIDPSELVWGLLVSTTAMTFVFAADANLSSNIVCPTYQRSTVLGFLGNILGNLCYQRTDIGTVAVWGITLSGLTTAALALFLPVVELWDRTHAEQKD